MAQTAIKKFNHLFRYHLGNLLFGLGQWRSAATQLSKVASRIRPDASSLASAQLFARIAICHLKLGSKDKAAEAYHSFRRVLDCALVSHAEDRKWLSVYDECLSQAFQSGKRAASAVTRLNRGAVSHRVKKLFPIEHLSGHFGIAMRPDGP